MKNLIRIFLLLAVTLLIVSCKIDGTLQGLVSYYNRTENEGKVKYAHLNSEAICSVKMDSATVLVANGKQLKSCLNHYEKAIVYLWGVKCSSSKCYPLSLVQEKCRQKGIELFVVASYYDTEYMSINYGELDHPIIGVDVKHYKTNFTQKYQSRFLTDLLTPMPLTSVFSDYGCLNKFICFTNGNFTRSFTEIDKI